MKKLLFVLLVLVAGPVLAQDWGYPRLGNVVDVASNDVLNVRAQPTASAPIIGALAHNARGVEIIERVADGAWGRVNINGQSGFVSMRYVDDRDWYDSWAGLGQPLYCHGTEPFWSAVVADFNTGLALQFDSMNYGTFKMDFGAVGGAWGYPDWGQPWMNVYTFENAMTQSEGAVVMRAELCSDGMSDQVYGIRAHFEISRMQSNGQMYLTYDGCCSLQR